MNEHTVASVLLTDLDPWARLNAVPGEGFAVETGGGWRLRGRFELQVLGSSSTPQDFGPGGVEAFLERDGDRWRLLRLGRTFFRFDPAIDLQRTPASPRLRSARVWLQRRSDWPVMLSFDDLGVSLLPTEDPEPGKLTFPNRLGALREVLGPLRHPDTNWLGHFLRSDPRGFCIAVGHSARRINLDHSQAVDLVIFDDSDLIYRISSSPSGLLESAATHSPAGLLEVEAEGRSGGSRLLARRSSHLAFLSDGPLDPTWTQTRIDRLAIDDGWLAVDTFREPELIMAHLDPTASEAGLAPRLVAPRERLDFALKVDAAAAHLTYRDDTVTARGGVTLRRATRQRERFYGLSLPALTSRRGGTVLDASLLVAELRGDRFEVEAGGEVQLQGRGETSWLVPKVELRRSVGRQLDLPATGANLRLRAEEPVEEGPSPLDYRSVDGTLKLRAPQLLAPPTGTTARAANAQAARSDEFAPWVQRLGADQPSLALKVEGGPAVPSAGVTWLTGFTAEPDQRFELLEYPGTGIVLDPEPPRPPVTSAARAVRPEIETTHFEVVEIDGKEAMVYGAVSALAIYAGVNYLLSEDEAALDDREIKLEFDELTEGEREAYVKANGLENLQLVYFTQTAGGGDDPQARSLIEDFLRANEPSRPHTVFYWPFATGLALLLRDEEGRYAPEIARQRGLTKTALAFDFSRQGILDPRHLGWTPNEWRQLAHDVPALWPRGSGRHGAGLDPSDPLWRGIFFRDLPMVVVMKPKTRELLRRTGFGFVGDFLDTMNELLVLEYGWKNESGSSWKAGFRKPAGVSFTPGAWKEFLDFKLIAFAALGASGKIVASEGEIEMELGVVRSDDDDPLRIRGSFGLDLTGGELLRKIEISAVDPELLATKSLPGFKSARLTRLATDLKSVRLDLELLADERLAAALPFLSSSEAVRAAMVLELEGDPRLALDLTLPAEVKTNLFGKWPLTVHGLRLRFGADVQLRVKGRLDLGIGGFTSIGVELVIRKTGAGWDLAVELEEIAGEVSIGGLRIQGQLEWSSDQQDSGAFGPLDSDLLSSQGKRRNFWGQLTFEGSTLLGRADLFLRVGTAGEMSYWVGVVQTSRSLKLGTAELRKPALLLAHNADRDGKLRQILGDLTQSPASEVRLPATSDVGKIRTWIRQWKPSKEIGTLVAGSGYLHLDDNVMSSPEGKDQADDPQHLTALIFASSGLLRVDAAAAFLQSKVIRFMLTIDFERQRLMVGLQVPSLSFPDEKAPTFRIDPGPLFLGIGWGPVPFFLFSLGWPEVVEGDEIERDWSKAIRVYIPQMFPINTFWGGHRALIDGNHLRFGLAIRAGWTWSYEASIGGVVKGSAELGIALGGVIDFVVRWNEARTDNEAAVAPLLLPMRVDPVFSAVERLTQGRAASLVRQIAGRDDEAAEVVAASLRVIEVALPAAMRVTAALEATIFADVWGKAGVTFMGIKLAAISIHAYARFQLCGDSERGITRAWARVGFSISVKIGCVRFRAKARVDIHLIRGRCATRSQLAPMAVLPVLPAFEPFIPFETPGLPTGDRS